MRIIEPRVEVAEFSPRSIMRKIESAARTCYKSEDKITPESSEEMVRRLIKSGHHAMLEHEKLTVRFITDRGVTHELVRHRLCAFAQESTRYCNYGTERHGGELTFIRPPWFSEVELDLGYWTASNMWRSAMANAETAYLNLLKAGKKPEEARSVLPNSLKTEIVTTANMREWRHILTLRTASRAHPSIRQITIPLLNYLQVELAPLFEDIPLPDDFPREWWAELSVAED